MDPLALAVALSRYTYNVDAVTRAKALYEHFGGDCAPIERLVEVCHTNSAMIVTELAPPTAAVYVNHALELYAEEAMQWVLINRMGSSMFPPPWDGEDKIAEKVDAAAKNVVELLNRAVKEDRDEGSPEGGVEGNGGRSPEHS